VGCALPVCAPTCPPLGGEESKEGRGEVTDLFAHDAARAAPAPGDGCGRRSLARPELLLIAAVVLYRRLLVRPPQPVPIRPLPRFVGRELVVLAQTPARRRGEHGVW